MRIILHTGKGGVGKTSVSAATGLNLARRGYRTLVMSVDAAHSLSDCFDLDRRLMDRRSGRVAKVADNLWIQEIEVQDEIERNWKTIDSYISTTLSDSGMQRILAEEVAIFPGMEEVSALLSLNEYLRKRSYDVVVLDCAPTAESLRFVSIPTTLSWYMKKVFKLERRLTRIVRPVLNSLNANAVPEDTFFQNLEELHRKLEGIDVALADPRITTIRLVTNPEKVVLKETQRAFTHFCLYRLTVDAVIVNRVLPLEIRDGFFRSWRASQEQCVKNVEEFFAPVPVWQVPLFQDEVLGVRRLKTMAGALYESIDPIGRFHKGALYRFHKENGNYHVQLRVPFAGRGDVDVFKKLDELIIRVGGVKRHVALPQRLVNCEPVSANISQGELTIVLSKKNSDS